MQNTLFKVFLTCMLLSSCGSFNTQEFDKGSHVRDENYETIANRITKQVALKLFQEKNLQCAGRGGGMMSNIRIMALGFDLLHEVTLTEARELTVYAITEYLKSINNSKEIRPYLQNYPFKLENIEIRIWIYKSDNKSVPLGKIDSISAVKGTLTYRIACGSQSYANRELCEETYEEALKIVEAEELANRQKIPNQEI